MKYRIEEDSIGKIKVDNNKYWGAQTQRSLENFVIGNEIMPQPLIKAIVALKVACAKANLSFKKIDKQRADAIIKSGKYILNGNLLDQFPLKIWQTGSGTQTNMNVNEVIANHANKSLHKKIIHPNDHVNMSQSSNDVFPSAIHISIIDTILTNLLPAGSFLVSCLEQKEKEFANIIKIGRTHLQDATPILLSQEISSWRASLEKCLKYILLNLTSISSLPIGGTAVGTGINAPKGFDKKVVQFLKEFYNKTFFDTMKNKFQGLAFKECVVNVHSQLKVLATSLYKIANDVRFLGSGPRAGIGELVLPSNEPGSSIMPGKVNPTQSEAMMMVCTQVMGNDVTISLAASQGNYQLNTFMPVIAYNALWSINLLTDAMNSFAKKCIVGIKVNINKIKSNVENSLMLVTSLSPKIGYANAAKIAKYAYQKNISLKVAALKLGYVNAKEFDQLVDPKKMI